MPYIKAPVLCESLASEACAKLANKILASRDNTFVLSESLAFEACAELADKIFASCDNIFVLSESFSLALEACARLANKIFASCDIPDRYTSPHLPSKLIKRLFRDHYPCITEPPDICSVYVGVDDEIPRWEREMVITFDTNKRSFTNPDDANYAEQQFEQAIKEWNKENIGVSFEKVEEDPLFTLEYGGKNGDCFARAFFPNSTERKVYVYEKAFRPCFKKFMHCIFRHEAGHILGLRHEFAHEREQHVRSVQCGRKNKYSCMGYKSFPYFPIQESDVVGAKALYEMGEDFKNWPVVNYE